MPNERPQERDAASAADHGKPAAKALFADAPWLKHRATQAVLSLLASIGHEGRLVGGAVRNALLGKPVGDIDIATTALPEAVLAAAESAGLAAVPTGIAHGTVTVIADHIPFEVTTLRTDVETDGRHARVAFTDDWSADAHRRDFTINALYCSGDGTVHDYVGGLADIALRRVRFIGDAHARIREDALRILRFFRISAEYGEGPLDRDGLKASVSERHLLARLSAERVGAELRRLFVAPRAVAVIEAMHGHGLLFEVLARPPRLGMLQALVGAETETGTTADAMLRLSALAVAVEEDRTWFADRFRLSRTEADALTIADPRLLALAELDPRDQRAELYRQGAAVWRRRVALAAASGALRDPEQRAALLALPDQWPMPTFPLRGADALALGAVPGPHIGRALAAVEREWVAGDFKATPAELRERLAELVTSGRLDG